MKTKYLLLITVLCLNSNILHSQSCGTIVDKATINKANLIQPDIDSYTKSFTTGPQDNRAIRYIPLEIYIVRDNNGNGGLPISDLNFAISSANDQYEYGEMEFFVCGDINYINDSYYYDMLKSKENQLVNEYYTPNKVNVYFFGSLSSGDNSLCGYSYLPQAFKPDIVMMSNNCTDNGTTFSHELGHFFGLYHTHGTSNCGELTDELVNGSNCGSAGDKVCDTAADPNLRGVNCDGYIVNTNCIYTGNVQDANGHYFDPDPHNIMSYSRKDCREHFSFGQLARANYYLEEYKDHLECNEDPPNPTGDGLQLYSDIEINPNPICVDEAVTIWYDVVNTDDQTFNGYFTIDIHDEYGDWLEELDYTNQTSLMPNYHYIDGITFNLGALDHDIGDYEIWAWAWDDGINDWVLLGEINYSNSVETSIIDCDQDFSPDAYEDNNSQSKAYKLSINGNTSSYSFSETELNIHNSSDIDHFKIEVEDGHIFSIDLRIHDSYESQDGNEYSNDVKFYYKIDNEEWSGDIDTEVSEIEVEGPATFYFRIESYYDREKGSYGLEVQAEISEPTFLEVDQESFIVDATEEQYSIDVTSNVSWTAESSSSWISITSGSIGMGDATVSFEIAENTSSDMRDGNIVVKAGSLERTIMIRQNGAESILEVTPSVLNIPSQEYSAFISIQTNTLWIINLSTSEFVKSISQNSGTGNKNLLVTFDENISALDRTMEIIISTPTAEEIISVVQEGAIVSSINDEEELANRIHIYPNPVSDFLWIESTEENLKQILFSVYDSHGKQIVLNQLLIQKTKIDLSEYGSGVYLIRFQSGSDEISRRVIVVK